jgi:WD40 repeat protein
MTPRRGKRLDRDAALKKQFFERPRFGDTMRNPPRREANRYNGSAPMQTKFSLRMVTLAAFLFGGRSLFAWQSLDAPHLVLQIAPEESVTSVAVSPDGSIVATNSFDGELRLHDARSGALLHAIGTDAQRGGRAVVFTPDGRGVACAGFYMDKLVRVWDWQTGKLIQTLAGHNEIETYAIAISPDGRWLASAGTDKQILIWKLATGTLKHRLAGQAFPVTALAFSPDSATLASGGGDRKIRLWDTQTGEQRRILEGHRDWISTLAFSANGKALASGSCDWAYHRGRDTSRFEGRDPGCESEWKLWQAATGDLKRSVSASGRLLSLAFSPDDQSLACGIGNDVLLYDLQSETPARVVTSHPSAITSVAFTRDGKSLISGSHDRTTRRVAIDGGTVEWTVPGYWEQVNSVAILRDGSLIATGTSDLRFAGRLLKADSRQLGPGAVRLWDARSGRLLRRLGDPSEQVMAVALSPDGQYVASGGASADGSGSVRLWNAESGTPVWSKQDHSSDVIAVAFTSDGSTFATADTDGLIKLRDPKTGAVVQTLDGHKDGATSIDFSTDGRLLACGAGDGVTHVWDVPSRRVIRTFRPAVSPAKLDAPRDRLITSVDLSSDGSKLVTCSASAGSSFGDRVVRIWNTMNGELLHELKEEQTRGRFVAISPDGTIVATNGIGKSISLWDMKTGEFIRKLAGHNHPPQSAVFSADGRVLVSGADYRQARVWDVASGQLLATLVTFTESHPGTLKDDWLAYTPDGYYDGSPSVERYLKWRIGDEVRSSGSSGLEFRRPDRLEAALNLRDAKAAAR